MEMAHNDSIPELTEAISARLVAQWEAWNNQDAASNDAIIADDFNSFWPDGSRHIGKPTAQQMPEQPMRLGCRAQSLPTNPATVATTPSPPSRVEAMSNDGSSVAFSGWRAVPVWTTETLHGNWTLSTLELVASN